METKLLEIIALQAKHLLLMEINKLLKCIPIDNAPMFPGKFRGLDKN